MADTDTRCCAMVYNDTWRHGHRCARPGSVAGTEGRAWCKQHDPVGAEARRRAAAEQQRIADIARAERERQNAIVRGLRLATDADILAQPCVVAALAAKDAEIAAAREEGRKQERDAVVRWLGCASIADSRTGYDLTRNIERGEHLTPEPA